MKKFLVILVLMLTSASLIFAQQPRFEMEDITILPTQQATMILKVYNLPAMDVSALTVNIKPSVIVNKFECGGLDEVRWPGLKENYDAEGNLNGEYIGAWVRYSSYVINNSIQSYYDGEPFLFVQFYPQYNTVINVTIELADKTGAVIPITVKSGKCNIGIDPPAPPVSWKCGDPALINGKMYGTKMLPVQKVCITTENYNDGKSIIYNGIQTGQYTDDFILPDGWVYPTLNAVKELNPPTVPNGYWYINGNLVINTYSFYFTSAQGWANGTGGHRIFYNTKTGKTYTEGNYKCTGLIRLVKK